MLPTTLITVPHRIAVSASLICIAAAGVPSALKLEILENQVRFLSEMFQELTGHVGTCALLTSQSLENRYVEESFHRSNYGLTE